MSVYHPQKYFRLTSNMSYSPSFRMACDAGNLLALPALVCGLLFVQETLISLGHGGVASTLLPTFLGLIIFLDYGNETLKMKQAWNEADRFWLSAPISASRLITRHWPIWHRTALIYAVLVPVGVVLYEAWLGSGDISLLGTGLLAVELYVFALSVGLIALACFALEVTSIVILVLLAIAWLSVTTITATGVPGFTEFEPFAGAVFEIDLNHLLQSILVLVWYAAHSLRTFDQETFGLLLPQFLLFSDTASLDPGGLVARVPNVLTRPALALGVAHLMLKGIRWDLLIPGDAFMKKFMARFNGSRRYRYIGYAALAMIGWRTLDVIGWRESLLVGIQDIGAATDSTGLFLGLGAFSLLVGVPLASGYALSRSQSFLRSLGVSFVAFGLWLDAETARTDRPRPYLSGSRDMKVQIRALLGLERVVHRIARFVGLYLGLTVGFLLVTIGQLAVGLTLFGAALLYLLHRRRVFLRGVEAGVFSSAEQHYDTLISRWSKSINRNPDQSWLKFLSAQMEVASKQDAVETLRRQIHLGLPPYETLPMRYWDALHFIMKPALTIFAMGFFLATFYTMTLDRLDMTFSSDLPLAGLMTMMTFLFIVLPHLLIGGCGLLFVVVIVGAPFLYGMNLFSRIRLTKSDPLKRRENLILGIYSIFLFLVTAGAAALPHTFPAFQAPGFFEPSLVMTFVRSFAAMLLSLLVTGLPLFTILGLIRGLRVNCHRYDAQPATDQLQLKFMTALKPRLRKALQSER